MNELCVFTASPSDAIAATRASPAQAEEPQAQARRLPRVHARDRRAQERRAGKPRATKVGSAAPRPKKPSKKQLEDAAEAARVAALAAAALERRNAPPVSKLEALALRVEERRSTSESAEVDEAEERPDRLRSRLRLKARSTSEPEQPFSDGVEAGQGARRDDGLSSRADDQAVWVLGGGGGVRAVVFACRSSARVG